MPPQSPQVIIAQKTQLRKNGNFNHWGIWVIKVLVNVDDWLKSKRKCVLGNATLPDTDKDR